METTLFLYNPQKMEPSQVDDDGYLVTQVLRVLQHDFYSALFDQEVMERYP